MMGDFLDMIIELILSERLGEELQKDMQYKAAITEEHRLYELLDSRLDEEQHNILKDYFDAVNARATRVESLVYKQGMKDLLSLFRSLSPDGESKLLRKSRECA